MGFTKAHKEDTFKTLAAILHLGNISFKQSGGAQLNDGPSLNIAAGLLGLEEAALGEVLTQQMRVLRGESISTPLDVAQAVDSRDSLSMALYSRLFKWIISKLNISLRGTESFHSIGLLDIFGFENFQTNYFEQFNINYANEKLQQYFNRHIFSLEQLEYNREGINWADIDWVDNAECLDLIERKLGILSLMDEESRFPKGTDGTLLSKLHTAVGGTSAYYIRPRVQNSQFGIKHYAGEVMYESTGLLEKNRDTFREDLQAAIQQGSDFIYELFDDLDQATGARVSTARKKPTVSFQFKVS